MKQTEKEFAALVKEQKSTIYSICYMFSKDKEEIDDLFQETLIHLWQGFEKFRNESKIETWVYRVTMNTCISMDRKEKRRGERIPLAVDIDLFDENNKYGNYTHVDTVTKNNKNYLLKKQLKQLSRQSTSWRDRENNT